MKMLVKSVFAGLVLAGSLSQAKINCEIRVAKGSEESVIEVKSATSMASNMQGEGTVGQLKIKALMAVSESELTISSKAGTITAAGFIDSASLEISTSGQSTTVIGQGIAIPKKSEAFHSGLSTSVGSDTSVRLICYGE